MSAEEQTLESTLDASGNNDAALPVSTRGEAFSADDQAQSSPPDAAAEAISTDSAVQSAVAVSAETGAGPQPDVVGEPPSEPVGEALPEGEAAVPSTEAAPEGQAAAEAAGSQRQWYVVHGYSGYENRVKKNLEQRIESMGMQDKIFQVIVPTEEEIEIRGGERRVVERRVFPGYILVEMMMDETSWYVVRNTPGVTGFVGSGNRPAPLSAEEVDKIMKRIEAAEPTIKVSFKVGQKVRLTDGAFADFVGLVDELYPEKGRARVLVSMFGRDTPLEVDLLHLERV